jgi:hypothetical protein
VVERPGVLSYIVSSALSRSPFLQLVALDLLAVVLAGVTKGSSAVEEVRPAACNLLLAWVGVLATLTPVILPLHHSLRGRFA